MPEIDFRSKRRSQGASRPTRPRLRAALLTLLLSAAVVPGPAIGQNDYSEDLAIVRSQIDQLTDETARNDARRNQLLKHLAEAEEEILSIEEKHRNALAAPSSQGHSQQDSRRAKNLQALELEQRIVAFRSTLPTHLEMAQHGHLMAAIRDNDVNRLARSRAYLQYLALSQTARIEELSNSLANAAKDDSKGVKQVLHTAQFKKDLAKKKSERDKIEGRIEALSALQADKVDELRQLLEDESHLVRLLAASGNPDQEEIVAITPPIEAPIKRNFGDPKKARGNQWFGVLYQAKSGQDIKAAAAGVVIFAKENKTLGKLVIIDHGNRLYTLYGHNSELEVRLGDKVSARQTIALAGDSGDAKGPALYFEVRENGEPVDPIERFARQEDSG